MTQFRIENTFILRAPLLPLEILNEISKSTSLPDLLSLYYSDEIASEALFLASPGLHSRLLDWLKNLDTDPKLYNSLLKYLIRMSSRCTPFGMFAGICSGSFGEESMINLHENKCHNLHIRLDTQIICGLIEKVNRDPVTRKSLRYFPNSSLYCLADEYRYIEYATDKEGIRHYSLQTTFKDDILYLVLEESYKGAYVSELSNLLLEQGAAEKDADAYINELIDNQVLVSELDPMVNGMGNDNELIRTEEIIPPAIRSKIKRLSSLSQGSRIKDYRDMLEELKETGLAFKENAAFQADMKLQTAICQLDEVLKGELLGLISLLTKLSRPVRNPLLESFKEKFLRRFEGREVPLCLALDAEAGLSYLPQDVMADNSDLTAGLRLPVKSEQSNKIDWTYIDSFLYRKLNEALLGGEDEIRITYDDVKSLPDSGNNFPNTMSAMVKIIGKAAGKMQMQLISAGGSSALRLAGRFCYLDKQLEHSMMEIALKEQELAGDEIVAEVLHLPQQRTGNILMRPAFYDYEIPYLARSGKETEYQIPITDLMLSIRDNKVMLRSKRLNKYIIPRLSNAHNYSLGSLAIYQFLCDLQAQDICTGLGFSWGPLEMETTYLPRMSFENFVLCPASWNLLEKDFQGILKLDEKMEMKVMHELRKVFKLPREVLICESDNELWIDLENPHCVRLFIDEVKQKKSVLIKEYIKSKGQAVSSQAGSVANEIIFFLHKEP